MKSVTTYVIFDGNARQAMSFYEKCLGAELQITPFPDEKGQASSHPAAKVMHAQLSLAGRPILQASDTTPGDSLRPGNNFHVSIDCESLEEIERLFGAIGKNGEVTMPLSDVPWGARFGMLKDQFGIQWFFNYTLPR